MSNLVRGSVGAAVAMFSVGTLAAISSVINRYPLYGGQALRYSLAALILAAVARRMGLAFVRQGCAFGPVPPGRGESPKWWPRMSRHQGRHGASLKHRVRNAGISGFPW